MRIGEIKGECIPMSKVDELLTKLRAEFSGVSGTVTIQMSKDQTTIHIIHPVSGPVMRDDCEDDADEVATANPNDTNEHAIDSARELPEASQLNLPPTQTKIYNRIRPTGRRGAVFTSVIDGVFGKANRPSKKSIDEHFRLLKTRLKKKNILLTIDRYEDRAYVDWDE